MKKVDKGYKKVDRGYKKVDKGYKKAEASSISPTGRLHRCSMKLSYIIKYWHPFNSSINR